MRSCLEHAGIRKNDFFNAVSEMKRVSTNNK